MLNMFAIIAGLVFSTAFLLAAGTIAAMFSLYRDKMIAALLFQPIAEVPLVYDVQISRRRVKSASRRTVISTARMPAFAA